MMHTKSAQHAEELAALHGIDQACLIAKSIAYDMLVDGEEEGFHYMQQVIDHLLRLSQ